MQRGVPEAFLEPVASMVSTFRMHLRKSEFFLAGNIVSEFGDKGTIDVDLEDRDEEYRRNSRYPL